ncbi:hypothetical protein GL982_06730 [Spiroplasma citri]|uniref:hypothetical protein n=1 Tax=Spiroplasma citri TaxID=2133 RepID=UPI0013A08C71|nr:hypothetical protein [Spiroplasma citri]QIA73322.1 hypothetical protein GL982_06730 [Spiroplasma citri]
MKKFFKEINLLKLIISFLIIITCCLMTTFLILCREWINDSKCFWVYIVVFAINIIISSLFIITVFGEILEFIKTKKKKWANK